MSADNVIRFLSVVAARPDVLAALRTRPKDEVLAAAAGFGVPFEESEYDATIWGLEERLAQRRGEEFGPGYTLWHLMWGQHYLEFVVRDLLPALAETGLVDAP